MEAPLYYIAASPQLLWRAAVQDNELPSSPAGSVGSWRAASGPLLRHASSSVVRWQRVEWLSTPQTGDDSALLTGRVGYASNDLLDPLRLVTSTTVARLATAIPLHPVPPPLFARCRRHGRLRGRPPSGARARLRTEEGGVGVGVGVRGRGRAHSHIVSKQAGRAPGWKVCIPAACPCRCERLLACEGSRRRANDEREDDREGPAKAAQMRYGRCPVAQRWRLRLTLRQSACALAGSAQTVPVRVGSAARLVEARGASRWDERTDGRRFVGDPGVARGCAAP